MNIQITWPNLEFPPINLNVLPPAWFFYASVEQKQQYFKEILESETLLRNGED